MRDSPHAPDTSVKGITPKGTEQGGTETKKAFDLPRQAEQAKSYYDEKEFYRLVVKSEDFTVGIHMDGFRFVHLT